MAHPYEERFVGYGKDRVSWNYELAARGAVFHVPADAFLVHFNTEDEQEVCVCACLLLRTSTKRIPLCVCLFAPSLEL